MFYFCTGYHQAQKSHCDWSVALFTMEWTDDAITQLVCSFVYHGVDRRCNHATNTFYELYIYLYNVTCDDYHNRNRKQAVINDLRKYFVQ